MRASVLLCLFAALGPAAPANRAALANKAAPAKKAGLSKRAAPQLSAFSKPVFENYVRHLFVWPTTVQVEISDPKRSPVPGFEEVRVRASQGKASQEEVFYISKDGQKIIRGQVFDVSKNPFQDDLDKLRTDFRPSLGTPGASVVIVEFSDFECQYCREEAKVLRENLLKDYPKEVRLYFADNPLEAIHPWAKAAAIAGQSVFRLKPELFWDYHDWIFDRQGEITAENFEAKFFEWAGTKSLDPLALKQMTGSKAVVEAVEQSLAMGRATGVQSTPTLFVNGRKLVGAVEWRELKRIIDYEIEYQKTAKNAGEDCGCEIKLSLPGAK